MSTGGLLRADRRDFRDSSTHQRRCVPNTTSADHAAQHRALYPQRAELHHVDARRQPGQRLWHHGVRSDDRRGRAARDRTSGGYVWRRTNTRYGYTREHRQSDRPLRPVPHRSIVHSVAAGAELSWEQARRGTYVTPGLFNAAGTAILASGSTITPRCNTATLARSYCTTLFSPDPNDPWVAYASDTATNVLPVARIGPCRRDAERRQYAALYAFDSITLVPQLILNLGARYDRFASTTRLPGTAGLRFRGPTDCSIGRRAWSSSRRPTPASTPATPPRRRRPTACSARGARTMRCRPRRRPRRSSTCSSRRRQIL